MVVVITAELDESSVDDVAQCQDRIVSQFQALFPFDSQVQEYRSSGELNKVVKPMGVVVLSRPNSVALFYICKSSSAVVDLRLAWCTGDLRCAVESNFNFLLRVARHVRVRRLTWPLTDYERCLDFLDFLSYEPRTSQSCTVSSIHQYYCFHLLLLLLLLLPTTTTTTTTTTTSTKFHLLLVPFNGHFCIWTCVSRSPSVELQRLIDYSIIID